MKQKDYEPDFVYDSSGKDAPAYCRWDVGYGHKDQQAGCLCPRTKTTCYKKKQCYWYKPKSESSGYGYEDEDVKNHGECIHNSERFYNILAHLLSKRGKKDVAIKIKYRSAAGKGNLPYGPHGPAIIGYKEDPHLHGYGGYGYGNPGYGYGSPYDYG